MNHFSENDTAKLSTGLDRLKSLSSRVGHMVILPGALSALCSPQLFSDLPSRSGSFTHQSAEQEDVELVYSYSDSSLYFSRAMTANQFIAELPLPLTLTSLAKSLLAEELLWRTTILSDYEEIVNLFLVDLSGSNIQGFRYLGSMGKEQSSIEGPSPFSNQIDNNSLLLLTEVNNGQNLVRCGAIEESHIDNFLPTSRANNVPSVHQLPIRDYLPPIVVPDRSAVRFEWEIAVAQAYAEVRSRRYQIEQLAQIRRQSEEQQLFQIMHSNMANARADLNLSMQTTKQNLRELSAIIEEDLAKGQDRRLGHYYEGNRLKQFLLDSAPKSATDSSTPYSSIAQDDEDTLPLDKTDVSRLPSSEQPIEEQVPESIDTGGSGGLYSPSSELFGEPSLESDVDIINSGSGQGVLVETTPPLLDIPVETITAANPHYEFEHEIIPVTPIDDSSKSKLGPDLKVDPIDPPSSVSTKSEAPKSFPDMSTEQDLAIKAYLSRTIPGDLKFISQLTESRDGNGPKSYFHHYKDDNGDDYQVYIEPHGDDIRVTMHRVNPDRPFTFYNDVDVGVTLKAGKKSEGGMLNPTVEGGGLGVSGNAGVRVMGTYTESLSFKPSGSAKGYSHWTALGSVGGRAGVGYKGDGKVSGGAFFQGSGPTLGGERITLSTLTRLNRGFKSFGSDPSFLQTERRIGAEIGVSLEEKIKAPGGRFGLWLPRFSVDVPVVHEF